MNTHVVSEGPHYGSGNDSLAALSQVSGGNHTYAGSSHDQLNERDNPYPYGYNYTPTGTPTHSYSTADRNSEHQHSLGRDEAARASMRKSGKLIPLKVQMLDDSVITLDVPSGCLGLDLFKECCRHLNLLEMDYFSLEYFNKADKLMWLDFEKPVARQVPVPKKVLFHFNVKFYLSDPGQLHDEFTKYLYALQIKKDLANGRLPCSENTAALMASYMLQAEVGDYSTPEHDDCRYISNYRFVPNQTKTMETKIQEYHKNHIGQTPADADFNLLDVARRLEMYGVHLHAASDYENVQLQLAVSHQGVLVFHNNSRINTFSWAKIRKLSFKRKRFLVKLHPEGFGYPRSTVEFMMATRNECKRFWKCCVEHHTFFRLQQPRHGRRPRRRLMSRGSTFRYSGRTQKQVVEDVRVTYIQRPGFGPSVARVSTRSLGAPRTTTPLTINLADPSVPDHHSAPDLSFGDGGGETYPNGAKEGGAPGSPASVSPTTPSSTPITPIHESARIAIHKGQSNSSITYEYTVNEDHPQYSGAEQNGGDSLHLTSLISAGSTLQEPTSGEESRPEAEPEPLPPPLEQQHQQQQQHLPQEQEQEHQWKQQEEEEQKENLEEKQCFVNGDHNGNEGLSTHYYYPDSPSDISIPSGSLHIDIDYEMRRYAVLDTPDETESSGGMSPLEVAAGRRRRRSRSDSEVSGSSTSYGSHSIGDGGEGLEYEDEIPTDGRFDLEILEKLGGPDLGDFDKGGKKRAELGGMGLMTFEIGETKAKLEILEGFQRSGLGGAEHVSPTKSVEAEMGSVGSGASGDLMGSMQAAASSGSSSSDEMHYVRIDTDSRMSSTIDEVLKIAADLASPTDEAYTPSFETQSLDSFLNEEESELRPKAFDGASSDSDGDNSKDYSSFLKERRLVFGGSSAGDSDDSSLGATLGVTNQNLTHLEEHLDETSANLRLLERSLAETRESLRAMEDGDVLSDSSTESPAFTTVTFEPQQSEIELTSTEYSPVFTEPIKHKPFHNKTIQTDSQAADIVNANTPISSVETYPIPVNVTKREIFNEVDIARAFNSSKSKPFQDLNPPPPPPPTPKVSVADPPTHIPQISTIELRKITSFDDMLPPPSLTSPPSRQRVTNIANLLPDLPPPPPLPLSPVPDSPPDSPLRSPYVSYEKPDYGRAYQCPAGDTRPTSPPCPPKPAQNIHKSFPPPPPPWTNSNFAAKESHVVVSASTRYEMSELTEIKTVFRSTESSTYKRTVGPGGSEEVHRATLDFDFAASEVSSIRRPPPPTVAPKPCKSQTAVDQAHGRTVIAPRSKEMRLKRPGTFVTELKMIVRPEQATDSDAWEISVGEVVTNARDDPQECAFSRESSAVCAPVRRILPLGANSDHRLSATSTESADSARQEFMDRSLEDILNSPDIVGCPTPDETRDAGDDFQDVSARRDNSETSSNSSGASDDSCVYHYQVADALTCKIKGGGAPLVLPEAVSADVDNSPSDDDGSSSSDASSAEENGLLNRHAMIENGGIVYTSTVSEGPRLFSDLQDLGSPLSALSGGTVVSSEDFD